MAELADARKRSRGAAVGKTHADRRVGRTLESIRNALFELLEEKNYNRITVTELAERAGINRKTFYMYYDGIEDLLSKIETSLVEKYRPLIHSIDIKSGTFDAYDFFQKVNRLAKGDITTYKVLTRLGLLPNLIDQVKQMIREIFLEPIAQQAPEKQERSSLFIEFASAGFLHMMSLWALDPVMTLEEFTDFAALTIMKGYYGVSGGGRPFSESAGPEGSGAGNGPKTNAGAGNTPKANAGAGKTAKGSAGKGSPAKGSAGKAPVPEFPEDLTDFREVEN